MQAIEAPYFTIIIPTKDRRLLLQKCLESVYAQRFTDYEVIIINDGQNDLDVIIDLKTRIVKNNGNERSAARNTGLALAKGKYICFVDDDDLITENFLEDFYQWQQENSHGGNAILRTRFFCIDEHDGVIRLDQPYDERKFKSPLSYLTQSMCGMTTVCIEAQLAKGFRFEESIHLWEDTHYLLRVMEGRQLVQLKSLNYKYRIHRDMSSMIQDKNLLTEMYYHNMEAINHYFDNYTSIELGERDRRYLIAEKQIEYAIKAKKMGMRSESIKWARASFGNCISPKFFRLYANLLKTWLVEVN